MNDKPVTVRIAPSPSGYLHVGVARTAIFNWLLARHHGGRFLVRIEDTDRERSDPNLIAPIIDALRWLGLDWDDKPIHQSTRLDRHQAVAGSILDAGLAYRCFCTPDTLAKKRERAKKLKLPYGYDRECLRLSEAEIQAQLAQGRPFAVRLKIPAGETRFTDLVSGELSRSNDQIEDFVIARSDGTATYNLAVVVDDHDMGITHVIRGNDHVTNTFKQLHIYRALGHDVPQFGHLPLILRPDKKKVSKRLGDKDVNEYKAEGVLSGALFNYLCLLGWSPKTDREIYTVEQLVERFTVDNFNAANAIFDSEKLMAFNREHIKLMSDHEVAEQIAPLLVEAGHTTKYWLETRWDYLRAVVRLLKERVKRLQDFVTLSRYFFSSDFSYDPKAETKHFHPETADRLDELALRFESLPELTAESAEAALSEVAEEKGIKRAALIHPTRLAVSGVPAGPGLYDILAVLTGPVVVERMRGAAQYIRKRKNEVH